MALFKDRIGFRVAGAFIASFLIIGVLALLIFTQLKKEETIKICAIISLTGSASHLVDLRSGMLLAAQEINSRGGINRKKIELIVEDNKTNPEEGKKAFQRIETEHHPVLYISALSSPTMALAPLAEKNSVVLIGLVASSPELTRQNDWVFRYYVSAEGETEPILYILKDLKVRTLGILYQDEAYGISVYRSLKEGFEKAGGKVIGESFNPKKPDFKAKTKKLKNTEAIYTVGWVKPARQAIRQLKEDHYKGFILAASGNSGLAEKEPGLDGVYLAAPIIYNPAFLFAKEVKRKYEARYRKTFNHQAANGYDFIRLLAGLLEDQEISRKNVKNLLEQGFIYPGVFGDIDVKPGEHDIAFPLFPAKIVENGIKYLR